MKFSIFKTFLLALIAPVIMVAQVNFIYAQNASILPPAKTQFLDQNGKPLSNGKVQFYIPGTTTPINTFKDSAATIPNTNPVVLDAGGRALILGNGFYREVVTDANNNLIWDQVTSSPGAGNSQTTIGDGNNVGTILSWPGVTPPSGYVFAYGQTLNRASFPDLLNALTQTQNATCTGGSATLTGIADVSQLPIGASVEVPCMASGSVIVSVGGNSVTLNNLATVNITLPAQFFPYGDGDGINTFNVPDLRGRTIVARNNMGGVASPNLITTYCGSNTNPNSIGTNCGTQAFQLGSNNLPPYTPSGVIAVTNGTISVSLGGSANPLIGRQNGISYASNAGAQVGATDTAEAIAVSQGGSTASFTGNAQGGVSTPISLLQPSFTQNYIIKTTPNMAATSTTVVLSLGNQQGNISCGANIVCTGNSIAFSGGTMAQQNSNAVAITGGTITGMANPVNPNDVANKAYADSIASGIIPLPSSNLATAAILPNTPTYSNGAAGVGATLTAGSNTTLTVDGILAALNSVILVKNQASTFQNGIYTVSQAGSGSVPWILTRATYFDQAAETKIGARTFITSGLTLAGNAYTLSATANVIGTDPLNFGLFSSQSVIATVNAQSRQSIMSSSVDNTGFANFATIGTGLNVNLTATTTPFILAFAAGFNSAIGALDFVGQLAADTASYWPSLPANQYLFLSVDRNAGSSALTATQTLVRPQRGPVFYAPRQALLHFDASNLVDDWGNTWNGVGAGLSFTAPCAKFGAIGLSITGTTSYIQSTQIFNPGLGNWTIDVWASVTSNTVAQNIFSVGSAFGMNVSINTSGKLLLFLSSGGVSWDISPGTSPGATTVTAGTFHHFALVFNGTTYVLYLDGVSQLTVTSSTLVWPDGVAMAMGGQVGVGGGTAGCFDEFEFVPYAKWVANFTPPVGASAVAGDWFDTNQMVMKTASGAGPTWTTIQRLYVAEAFTAAGSVSAVYNYAPSIQYRGADFSLNSTGKLRVADHVYFGEGTPQFITGSTPGTPCTTVPACTIGSPVTWVIAPSLVPPDAKWFDIQINVFHAAIGGANPGNQDCTLQSRIPIGTIQNFVSLGWAYSNFTGFGTITNTTAFTETSGTIARFPVLNGIAAFETTINGTTCSTGGTNNQARIVAGILIGYGLQ